MLEVAETSGVELGCSVSEGVEERTVKLATGELVEASEETGRAVVLALLKALG